MTLDVARLSALIAAHGPVARVVLARTRGSVPRGAGTSMTVWSDGFDGTIGGGALEWRALSVAREVLASGAPRVEKMPLGPALGQCCGGSVTMVIERLDATPPSPWLRRVEGAAAPPDLTGFAFRDGWLREEEATPARAIWIWGAGHVGAALVSVLSPLPDIALTWVDTAADRFPAVPEGVTGLVAADSAAAMLHAPIAAEHIILTYSHDIDLALCHAALGRGFRSVGLIGSATKWARFRSRLAALGHAPAQIDRIRCPIGDPALGKHPQAIAVGVAAALLSQGSSAEATGGRTA
ncbi:xanthine dehydrogenase accessory protein XdhC [Jannaschia rubra]|uniref:Xanthine dehydrogenase accessory protein XdhC n=1 Tax=Jannaschia rubra TaxID=282197 RepID=A0A0M6XTJ7_9RHOB|nr:xanthine dehydrogenase accessory protein XdhC [Jannaschia rubra]CTQ33505.1 xanthine dehydrogenase accessory protein XdhC [Jannaschia rubra]SFG02899.1 molybdenum cofactor sulfurylase [Jannaschia rubra]